MKLIKDQGICGYSLRLYYVNFKNINQALLGVFTAFWLFHFFCCCCFVFIELTHPVLGFVEYFINDE